MTPKIFFKNLIIIIIFGVGVGFGLVWAINHQAIVTADTLQLDDQEATIRSIQTIQPAVVSVIVSDEEKTINIDLKTGQQSVSQKQVEKGSGSGFIISANGLILTNKHVVEAADSATASFEVITNNGTKYDAKLMSKDPINDLAILKINDLNLPFVKLGDSDQLQVGTTVVAIGNSLGRYQNSATKGIVSGLGRDIVASDQTPGSAEALNDVIQTDAEINPGNSGGPLINLEGEVVGVNVATDSTGQSIGFAIPINDVKSAITSFESAGKIIRARLGVRYVMITPELAAENNLDRIDGALVVQDETGQSPVVKDSPADKAGIKEGDIIFEIGGVKLEGNNTLVNSIQKYKPGDQVVLKIQRGNDILTKTVTLDQFPES